MNNQKGFANIALIVLVIVLAGALGYVTLVKKQASVEQPQTNNSQNTQSTTPPPATQPSVTPPQTDTSFKVLSPKAGDSWKIGETYFVKFQNLPKGSFVQGWLQEKSLESTGSARIGVMETGRDGNPSSNIQIKVPSQWCGGACGAVEYVTPGQYRLILTIHPSAQISSYQRFYSDWFTIQSASGNWKTCVNTKYGYEAKYPPTWKVYKPGAPEARLADCNLAIIALSPNLFEYPLSDIVQINIDVSDQERLRGTVYEGSKSIDDYFTKNPAILQNSPKIKEITIDGEKLVWLEGNWLLAFHDGSIFEFRFNNVDNVTLDNFIKVFKFR